VIRTIDLLEDLHALFQGEVSQLMKRPKEFKIQWLKSIWASRVEARVNQGL
jgi:hypothetical protein